MNVLNFPQSCSFATYCRIMTTLIDMPAVNKMKLAFSFYTHRYEDRITLTDAFTVMGHLSDQDYMLQKDLKQILMCIQRANHNSKGPNLKSLDKISEEGSPEKRIITTMKVIKKKKR